MSDVLTLVDASQCDYMYGINNHTFTKKAEYTPMKEPGTGIVGLEANGHFVSAVTDADDVTPDRIDPVVSAVASAAHNIERVLWISLLLAD